jgi:hypothetical protein
MRDFDWDNHLTAKEGVDKDVGRNHAAGRDSNGFPYAFQKLDQVVSDRPSAIYREAPRIFPR